MNTHNKSEFQVETPVCCLEQEQTEEGTGSVCKVGQGRLTGTDKRSQTPEGQGGRNRLELEEQWAHLLAN